MLHNAYWRDRAAPHWLRSYRQGRATERPKDVAVTKQNKQMEATHVYGICVCGVSSN